MSDVVGVYLVRVRKLHCAKLPLYGVKPKWHRDKDNTVLKREERRKRRRAAGSRIASCWNLTAVMRDFSKLTDDDEESCSGYISVHLKSEDGLSNFYHLYF